jgi:hypothetical protein
MKSIKAFLLTAVLIFMAGTVFGQTVTYSFRPPQNNFYIKWRNLFGNTEFHGYINGGLWSGDSDRERFFTSEGRYYYRDDNRWYPDDIFSSSEVKEKVTKHLAEPEMLGLYYANFWNRYNTAAGGNLRADLYHKGRERFLGINCDIFVDNSNSRYWIDPSNGCTLKIADARGNVGFEVFGIQPEL